MQKTGTFEDRFLSKLNKIDKQEVENFLANLVREKHFLQIVFNAMVDGVAVMRPNLEVLYINDAAVDLLGINPRRRIIQESLAGLVPLKEFRELLARFALNHKRIIREELEVPAPAMRLLHVSLIPLDQEESRAGTAVMIVHDMTEARRHSEEREKAERATTLSRLTGSLAHEIKNPLNSLQIHAQLLQKALNQPRLKPTDRDRVLRHGDIIVEEIQRLNNVVNKFLTAVRPTRPLKERCDINKLVEQVAATIKPELDAAGIEFTLIEDHDIPAAEVDPNQLKQALINLIKNSIEALSAERDMAREAGGGAGQQWLPHIEVRTILADRQFRIRVADNGPGIPEEDLKRILEPYFTTKFSGTGLGLAIVSRIVEEHAGQMEIASQPGDGTAIIMGFPLGTRPVRLIGDGGSDEKYLE